MPIARVELPDGRIARFDVPEGTTPQQVEAFALEFVSRKRAPDAIERSAMQAQRPTALERLGRGVADVTQGLTQRALELRDTRSSTPSAPAYTAEKTQELQMYEQGRGPNAGVDWMRLGGNIGATAPTMLIPGGSAATLGGRMLSGAAQGAAASGAMFTPEGESTLERTLIGAGVGAAVPAAIEGIRRAVRSVAGATRGQVSLPDLRGEITFELKKQGIDFNALTREVQKSLLDDAQASLNTGGAFNPTQMARKADIETVGAKGTQASITRDPRQWQTQKNMRGIAGVGDDIVRRESDDAVAMVDYLQKLRAGTGGKAGTTLEAGESAIGALRKADAARESVVDDLYKAYRSLGQQNEAIPATKIADTLGRVADEIGVENIPAPVLNRLKEFGLLGGQQTKLLTINEADKLNRLINNNNPGKGTVPARALAPIKEALNEALLDIPDNTGSKALMTARKAAADMFAAQRVSSGVGAAIDDVAPDRFVKKFILDAPTRDMRATLKALKEAPGGAQALSDIKGTVLDSLLLKATGATNAEDVLGRPFSGRNFAKALDAIPAEKLHTIFSPQELASLRTLQRASKYLTEEVPFSDVNYSKTTAALANLLQKVGSTPLLGQALSPIIGVGKIGMDWVKDAGQRKAVAELLLTTARQAGQSVPAQLPAAGRITRLAPAVAASGLNASRQNED